MANHIPYHYKECGLDNIYLTSGVEIVSTPRGDGVSIKDIEGLHKAIGLALVRDKRNLTGKELRFLRHEMNLTQRNLAAILRVDVQSLARWEKRTKIDGPADGFIRMIYEKFLGRDPEIVEPLTELAELDEMEDDECDLSFDETEGMWQPSLAA